MTVKAEIGGEGLEIWFTPSFNIKCTNAEMAHYIRELDFRVFDPMQTRMRTVKVTQGEWEAYLLLEHLRINFPKLGVKITEHPKLDNGEDKKKRELLY